MKLPFPFMQLPLLFDASALQAEIAAVAESAWRPHPQGYPGNDALTLITAGGDPNSDAASGPMRPTIHLERSPYLQQVLHSIGATWGRTRLMRLSGQAKVLPHVDVNYYWRERARVHVPIVTQPTVRFSCGDAQVNMRAGECWIFDTWRTHNVSNDHAAARIHLVADTVGGAQFWEHLRNARPYGREVAGWAPRVVAPDPAQRHPLDFESENLPDVMTPWEVRAHIAFIQAEAVPHAKLARVVDALMTFAREWHALWSCHGVGRTGWPKYRTLLDTARTGLVLRGSAEVVLRNGVGLLEAFDAWVFEPALADRRTDADPEIRQQPVRHVAPGTADPVFDRPVFIVSPPRSGSTFLFETLLQAPGVYTIGDESHQLIEGIAALAPEARGFSSNRLLAEDATPPIAEELRARFLDALRDRDQRRPASPAGRLRMLEKTPKNALRVSFLARVFPEARFIYLYRDPKSVLSSMMEAWSSGRFRTYPQLPGWTGLPWSLLLVPGWRDLIGQPLNRIVAAQWSTTTRLLLDDLQQLPEDRWIVARYEPLVSEPEAEIRRLCDAVSLDWDRTFDRKLPLSRYTVSPPDPQKWRRHAAEIEAVLPLIEAQSTRARLLAAN
jgi:hypothetical protein